MVLFEQLDYENELGGRIIKVIYRTEEKLPIISLEILGYDKEEYSQYYV